MTRTIVMAGFLIVWMPALVPADEKALKEALVLEAAMQEAIKSAESSVACILVSRSEEYQRLRVGPLTTNPGELGDFSPERLGLHIPEQIERYRKLDLSDPEYVPESFGSGVVVGEKDKLILTNYHVVKDATKVYVRLPGEKGSYANIHAADPRSDLAVLKLIDKNVPLKEIKFGDGGTLKKGQFIISLAHPFAAGVRDGSPSASWGIVSNIRRPTVGGMKEEERSKLTLAQFGSMVQIDARLNLGCSGGALLNLKGEMVGIPNALAAISGVETPGGFALPLDTNVQAIVEILKRGEEVEYGFLGVRMRTSSRRSEVYQIDSTISNSPASTAGLGNGHYIISINGVRIHDANDLYFNIGVALAGSTVKLEVARDPQGPTETLRAKLVKGYVTGKIIAANQPDPKKYGGLRVDYTSILVQRKIWPATEPIPTGVMIREVLEKSPASTARLQEDKVISQVNGKAINSPAEFYREVDKAGKSVELTIATPGEQTYKVKLELN